jgi:hypothetical protein
MCSWGEKASDNAEHQEHVQMDMFLVFGWWEGQGWVPNTLIWVLGGWRGKGIPADASACCCGICEVGGRRVVMRCGCLVDGGGQGYPPTHRYGVVVVVFNASDVVGLWKGGGVVVDMS